MANTGDSPDPDGNVILAIARDLSLRMGMGQEPTHSIEWQRFLPLGRAFLPVPSDQPLARRRRVIGKGVQIVFPREMRGKLRPEEWRPLIASLFAYSKMRRKKDFISPFVVAILLLGAGGYLLVRLFFSNLIPQSITVVWLVSIVVLVVFVPRVIGRNGRGTEAWLRADRMAATVTGRDPFLAVLVRIDSMHLNDVEELKEGKGPWAYRKPSIAERVRNLEDFAGTTQPKNKLALRISVRKVKTVRASVRVSDSFWIPRRHGDSFQLVLGRNSLVSKSRGLVCSCYSDLSGQLDSIVGQP